MYMTCHGRDFRIVLCYNAIIYSSTIFYYLDACLEVLSMQRIYYFLQHWRAKSMEHGMASYMLTGHKHVWFTPIMIDVCCWGEPEQVRLRKCSVCMYMYVCMYVCNTFTPQIKVAAWATFRM